jgi:hypothetical protein
MALGRGIPESACCSFSLPGRDLPGSGVRRDDISSAVDGQIQSPSAEKAGGALNLHPFGPQQNPVGCVLAQERTAHTGRKRDLIESRRSIGAACHHDVSALVNGNPTAHLLSRSRTGAFPNELAGGGSRTPISAAPPFQPGGSAIFAHSKVGAMPSTVLVSGS